jgi:hypothetical protein
MELRTLLGQFLGEDSTSMSVNHRIPNYFLAPSLIHSQFIRSSFETHRHLLSSITMKVVSGEVAYGEF